MFDLLRTALAAGARAWAPAVLSGMVVALALLALLALQVTPTQAAGVVTSCTEGAFVTALAGGGTVTFDCGSVPVTITLTSSQVITAPTTIEGGGRIVLSGGGAVRLFTVNTGVPLTLSNLTLDRGYSNSSGGGALPGFGGAVLSGGPLVLSGTTIQASRADFFGGAIYGVGGSVRLVDSRLSGNVAAVGGAVVGIVPLTVLGGVIEGNRAAAGAGGGLNVAGTTVISGARIVSNTAKAGGGIESTGALTLVDSLVASNAATSTVGGGLDITGTAIAVITGSTILSNTAVLGGGGLNIAGGARLTVAGSYILANGVPTSSASYGGGVRTAGVVTVSRSLLDGNSAYYGGGMYNDISGTATLNASTLSSNPAVVGGGLYNDGTASLANAAVRDNSGGGIYNSGTVTLTNATVSGHSIIGAAGTGGGLYNDGTATLTGVTLSANSAALGGGIYNYATVMLTNVTLSDNSARRGGGIYNSLGAATLVNVTISANSATFGGGLYNDAAATLTNVTLSNSVPVTGTASNLYLASGVLTLTNTILTSPEAGDVNCFGGGFPKAVSGGHNLASDSSCGLTSSGDRQGPLVQILLGPLTNNGGPTLTQIPLPGSKAIDAIPLGICPPPAADQRGVLRPLDGDGDGQAACDIGAVEVGAKPALTAINPASATAGGPGFVLTVVGTGFLPGAQVLWNGVERPTAPGTASVLTATIPATDLAAGGTITVAVRNGASPAETSNALPFTIDKADQTIAFAPLPDRSFGDAPFNVTASASSGLPVSFAAAGTCTVSGNTVTLTGVGSCAITALQGGNGTYRPAPSIQQSFSIGAGQTVVYLPASQVNFTGGS